MVAWLFLAGMANNLLNQSWSLRHEWGCSYLGSGAGMSLIRPDSRKKSGKSGSGRILIHYYTKVRMPRGDMLIYTPFCPYPTTSNVQATASIKDTNVVLICLISHHLSIAVKEQCLCFLKPCLHYEISYPG